MKQQLRPWQQIQWEIPPRAAGLIAPSHPASSLATAIREFGRPSVPGATPLEEAQILLSAGAEIEHALLVEYLYAFWSMGNDAHSEDVRTIAIQEMCHLITVQNLLLFTGGSPFLDRQDQDPHPMLDPFAFALRPLTVEVLESFLLAERPPEEQMSDAQRAVMAPIIKARGLAFHPVGVLYAAVFWLFQENDQPNPIWPEVAQTGGFVPARHIDSFPGTNTASTFQADPTEPAWHSSAGRGGIFQTVDSRESALQTIGEIAGQGEGLTSSPGTPSHFGTFFDIHTFFTANAMSLPVIQLPTNPFLAAAPAADPEKEKSRITHSLASTLCRVFDTRYQILLATLRGALSRNRTLPADGPARTRYASWALEEMRSNLRGLVRNIVRLPAKDGGTVAQLAAAPTFTLGEDSLPDDPKRLDDLILDLHRSSEGAITAALAKADVAAKITLQSIQVIDKQRFSNL